MRVATETHRRGGVTLVAARVTNDADGPRRVRIADRCGGEVWPPRERGLSAPGWDDGGWEGVLGAGAVRPLGYATPAEPADPPVEVAWAERAADHREAAECGSGNAATRAADRREAAERASGGAASRAAERSEGTDCASRATDHREGTDRASGALAEFGDPRPPRDAVAPPASDLPEGVREWLADVSNRASEGAASDADRESVRALAARASVLRERVRE